jgi:hypothetical protein
MTIQKPYVNPFKKAIKQASQLIKDSNLRNRFELAQNMWKDESCDFLTVNFDDDDSEKENNDNIDLNVMDNNSK